MFDFRYHALSLIAVLVALIVGLLLGIAIGDQGLVSSAERGLRDDLRSDVHDAQADAAELSEELERRTRYEELTLPGLIGGRLSGRRVHLVFLGARSETVFDQVRASVETAGGALGLVGTLEVALDVEGIAEAAEGTQYERLPEDPDLMDDLGRRLGSQLIGGGRLLREVRPRLLSASSGPTRGASALVVARSPEDAAAAAEQEPVQQLINGLFDGVAEAGGVVVGVEETTTDPSQVPWYRDFGLVSVDNVDEVPGMASLAVVLAGEGDGAYGIKPTRDAYVPDALVRLP